VFGVGGDALVVASSFIGLAIIINAYVKWDINKTYRGDIQKAGVCNRLPKRNQGILHEVER
jgi:hypothetical protein